MRRAPFLALATFFCAALSADGRSDGTPAAAPLAYDFRTALARPDTVASYTLRVRLDPQTHRLDGSGVIAFRNVSSQPLSSVWVHLYLNAFKNERTTFLREQNGGRGNRMPTSWGSIDVRKFAQGGVDLWPKAELHPEGETDETDVKVPLATPVPPGEEVRFDMAWDATLPNVIERTGFSGSFHMVGQWFPKLAKLEKGGAFEHFPFHHLAEFYADFGNYDVTIDCPKAFVVGATGVRTESREAGERRIDHYLQNDIHDFAFTAWDQFVERSETMGSVNVRVLYPPSYDAVAKRELDTIRFALPHYGDHYGPYPYSTLTIVHPPDGDANEAGGMEYPTLITTGGPWYTPSFVHSIETMTIHEFGHQYFYGLLASNEMKWPFLDEGLNSYAETEALGAWLGEGSGGSLGRLDVSVAAVHSVFGKLSQHDEAIAKPAHAFHSGGSYARLVYSRTAAILETFARVYGRPLVTTALRDYATRFRFRHPTPDDLLQVMGEHLGQQARSNLRAALFDKAWVDYAMLDFHPTSAKARISRRGTLSFPVEVAFYFDDGTSKRVSWNGVGEEGIVTVPGAGQKCVGAMVDPDHHVLVDTEFRNNAVGNRKGQPSAVLGATALSDILMGALSP
ncbi:MAG: M1 family metallopeptidase [Polyangiaceae bacterium]